MKRKILSGLMAALTMTANLLLGGSATAQDAASYYEGKVIDFIVPYKPGGGYDEYARLIAPYLEEYTGARVDIKNVPGSGGLKGANEIFNSPIDGLTIGIINGSAMITNELAEIEGANYKIAEFNFLGRIVADQRVLIVSTISGIGSFEELMSNGETVVLGATGLGGASYVDAVINGTVLGIDQKLVHGFNSSGDVRAAMLRGDIHGMWISLGSGQKGVLSGDHKIILHGEKNPSGLLAGIPNVFDIAAASDDAETQLSYLESWVALSAVGRPVAAPPGVSEDRVEFLRAAFDKAMQNPDFVNSALERKRSLAYSSGVEMGVIAKSATALTPETRSLFVNAIRGEI